MKKTEYLKYSKFQKGHNSYKIKKKLDMKFINWNLYTKFQLNMSQYVGENAENCVFPVF